MSLTEAVAHQLDLLADALREDVDHRVYRVDVALAADDDFGTCGGGSTLRREMVTASLSRAASQQGVETIPVRGGGLDLRFFDDDDQRFRLRHGKRNAADQLIVNVNPESSLICEAEEPGFWPVEKWVLIWTNNSDGMIAELLVAHIAGHVVGNPGYLLLDSITAIGAGPADPISDFVTTDEDEDLFDDEEGDTGTAAAS